jgi:3-isopropylmalate dehydratase small subunit|tara:strand:- start:75 stop:266 length:192 start_codon:yes stop_codon:yes gene_type:complete
MSEISWIDGDEIVTQRYLELSTNDIFDLYMMINERILKAVLVPFVDRKPFVKGEEDKNENIKM